MELKEAREIAQRVKSNDLDLHAPAMVVCQEMFRVAVVLDNRITELEAEREKRAGIIGELLEIVENTDFENEDDAPSNEEMNCWHDAAIIEAVVDDKHKEK